MALSQGKSLLCDLEMADENEPGSVAERGCGEREADRPNAVFELTDPALQVDRGVWHRYGCGPLGLCVPPKSVCSRLSGRQTFCSSQLVAGEAVVGAHGDGAVGFRHEL